MKEYLNDSREMYFDYDEFTPGEKVWDYQGLKNSIVKIIYNNSDYQKSYSYFRKKIRKKVFDENLTNIVRLIQKNMNM